MLYNQTNSSKSTLYQYLTENTTYFSFSNLDNTVKIITIGFDEALSISKEKLINNYILMAEQNMFLSETQRTQLQIIYTMGNRTRIVLGRFAFRWKWYRSKQYDVDCDLESTPLNEFSDTQIITLFEPNHDGNYGTLYRFRITDLIRVIVSAVLNMDPDMFADPTHIRNPYTNVIFSYANLYNIYFFIRNSQMDVPIIIRLLFSLGFDVSKTLETHEAMVRDMSIRSHCSNLSRIDRVFYIREMLDMYATDHHIQFQIHFDFPNSMLIDTFTSFLDKYLLSVFSFNPDLAQRCFTETGIRIFQFKQMYPQYGRRIQTNVSDRTDSPEYIFISEK